MVDETNRYSVAEASRVLGITETAVRARIQRGTIDSEREGGTVYVRLSGDEAVAKAHEQSELVEALRDQIATLKRQLDEANAANGENRRIIAALTQRIPELEPPREPTPEPRESPVSASEEPGKDRVHPEREKPFSEEEREQRPWWVRLFGG